MSYNLISIDRFHLWKDSDLNLTSLILILKEKLYNASLVFFFYLNPRDMFKNNILCNISYKVDSINTNSLYVRMVLHITVTHNNIMLG